MGSRGTPDDTLTCDVIANREQQIIVHIGVLFWDCNKKPTDSAEIDLWQFHIDTASTGTRASEYPVRAEE